MTNLNCPDNLKSIVQLWVELPMKALPPGYSIKMRVSVGFSSDTKSWEGWAISKLHVKNFRGQREWPGGRGFWLEGWKPTSTLTVLHIKYLAYPKHVAPVSWVIISFPIYISGPNGGLETNKNIYLCPGFWVLQSRSEKSSYLCAFIFFI